MRFVGVVYFCLTFDREGVAFTAVILVPDTQHFSPKKRCVMTQITATNVNNRFSTNYKSKQTAHYRSHKFVTIFIVLTLNAIGQFAKNLLWWLALVGVVAL